MLVSNVLDNLLKSLEPPNPQKQHYCPTCGWTGSESETLGDNHDCPECGEDTELL